MTPITPSPQRTRLRCGAVGSRWREVMPAPAGRLTPSAGLIKSPPGVSAPGAVSCNPPRRDR